MDRMKRLSAVVALAGLGLALLAGLAGCLLSEPADSKIPSDGGTTVTRSSTTAAELNCDRANPEDWQVVPPPCEVVACWHQPAELVSAVEFVRVGREEGIEEHVRIEPDGAYEVTIVQSGEIVEQYEGVLAPATVAELAGLLYDWETDAEAVTSQDCPFPCGRYEITYASRTCGWPAGCAIVPRALKCAARRVMENTALDLDSVCVRMEFLDR